MKLNLLYLFNLETVFNVILVTILMKLLLVVFRSFLVIWFDSI